MQCYPGPICSRMNCNDYTTVVITHQSRLLMHVNTEYVVLTSVVNLMNSYDKCPKCDFLWCQNDVRYIIWHAVDTWSACGDEFPFLNTTYKLCSYRKILDYYYEVYKALLSLTWHLLCKVTPSYRFWWIDCQKI